MKKKIAQEVLREIYETLQLAEVDNAKQEAELLFFHALHWNKIEYIQNHTIEVADSILKQLDTMVDDRLQHKPLQYILGEWEFMGLSFFVGEGVLIPRQDTELLVETILSHAKKYKFTTGVDLGTGTGCIPIALSHHGKLEMSAVDISKIALSYSQKNAEALGVKVDWYEGDLFHALPETMKGKLSFVVSNPPYICSDVIPTLMEEVKDFEPLLALDGGVDGLIFYQRIIEESLDWLCDFGWLFFEIGYDQGHDVLQLMMEHGFSNCEILNDLNGLPRVVFGNCNKIRNNG